MLSNNLVALSLAKMLKYCRTPSSSTATFLSLICVLQLQGMYCMDGNIAGATTILEHMKQVSKTLINA